MSGGGTKRRTLTCCGTRCWATPDVFDHPEEYGVSEKELCGGVE